MAVGFVVISFLWHFLSSSLALIGGGHNPKSFDKSKAFHSVDGELAAGCNYMGVFLLENKRDGLASSSPFWRQWHSKFELRQTFRGHFFLFLYFTSFDNLQLHPCCCKWFCSFYSWIVYHCIYVLLLLIHLSVEGHIGFFHVLAIVNSAAMNLGVHVSFLLVTLFTFYFSCAWSSLLHTCFL